MSTVNVEMHGDLGRVRCVLCMKDFEAREEWMEMFRMGEAPWCPACKERCKRSHLPLGLELMSRYEPGEQVGKGATGGIVTPVDSIV